MQAITQSGKQITLSDKQEINRGGEGRILLIPELPNMVAKLSFDTAKVISTAQLQALKALPTQYFITPAELVFEKASRQPLGFTMPLLDKNYVPLTAFFSEPFCRKHQITYNRKLQIAQEMLIAMLNAHQQQIVLGDLSGLNAMICPTTGSIKFIDTDAYQTAAQKHSGILLDDIRDYYYGGLVSPESDFFALAVVVFQLFTYLHPYKGIHRLYATLRERMIHRIPVFDADPNLTVPKCYQPIADAVLQQQFTEIFKHARRFALQLNITGTIPANTHTPPPNQTAILPPTGSAITVKTIYLPQQAETLTDITCSDTRLVAGTNQQWLVYDTSQPKAAKLLFSYNRTAADAFFAATQQVVALKNGKLFVTDDNGNLLPITNLLVSPDARWVQYQNLLAIVEPDSLKIVHLNQIISGQIYFTQTPVFGAGFKVSDTGLWQLVGGKWYVFYHSGNTLSSVYCPFSIYNLHLQGNIGIITHQQQAAGSNGKQLLTEWVSIRNMQLTAQKGQPPLPDFTYMAYKPNPDKTPGLLFEPTDDHLTVRRAEDFTPLQTLPCPNITNHDRLYYTRAGLVCYTAAGSLLLLNMGA